jgi:hypothetical protein
MNGGTEATPTVEVKEKVATRRGVVVSDDGLVC